MTKIFMDIYLERCHCQYSCDILVQVNEVLKMYNNLDIQHIISSPNSYKIYVVKRHGQVWMHIFQKKAIQE